MTHDPRVDAYIARAAPFAQPILSEIRARMHAAYPEVAEAIKWSMPFFVHNGALLANMAAFKGHAAFGFWKGAEIVGDNAAQEKAMGQFGRIISIADLPAPAVMAALIDQAVSRLAAPLPPRPAKAPKPTLATPDDLRAALAANPAAQAAYDRFAPGQQREYIEWLIEAKRPETRAKRLAQAVAWIAEGKTRNWKYANC